MTLGELRDALVKMTGNIDDDAEVLFDGGAAGWLAFNGRAHVCTPTKLSGNIILGAIWVLL